MNINTLTNNVIEAVEELSKFTKTHPTSFVDFDSLDDLEKTLSDLQEITYELESRVQEEDLSDYEEM